MTKKKKIVKITNGKVLNYTIEAPGYKTIIADKLITQNDTIEHVMLPEISEDGIYAPGDRIGNIATFVCYFGAIDRNTGIAQKYAVFVVDAKYRVRTKFSNTSIGQWAAAPKLPIHTQENALNTTDSATWNTDTVLNTPNGATDFPAFYVTRNIAEITIGNTVYKTQIPNIYELKMMWINRTSIDAADPTVKQYSTFALSSWSFTDWNSSSTVQSELGTYGIDSSGAVEINAPGSGNTLGGNFYIFPVFEIPVN